MKMLRVRDLGNALGSNCRWVRRSLGLWPPRQCRHPKSRPRYRPELSPAAAGEYHPSERFPLDGSHFIGGPREPAHVLWTSRLPKNRACQPPGNDRGGVHPQVSGGDEAKGPHLIETQIVQNLETAIDAVHKIRD